MTKRERMKKAIEAVKDSLEPQEIYRFAAASSIATRPAEGMTYRCIADMIKEVTGQEVDWEDI